MINNRVETNDFTLLPGVNSFRILYRWYSFSFIFFSVEWRQRCRND